MTIKEIINAILARFSQKRKIKKVSLFYGDSKFDTESAPDKGPYRKGETMTFACVSSYVHGINGMTIEFDRKPQPVTIKDFAFRTLNPDESWSTRGTAPILTRISDTAIRLTWPNGYVVNTWLEVRLVGKQFAPDTFYFGSLVAGLPVTEDNGTIARVSLAETTPHTTSPLMASITNIYDFNRNKTVESADLVAARDNDGKILRKLNI